MNARRAATLPALGLLLALTWAVDIYHVGVFPKPKVKTAPQGLSGTSLGRWYPSSESGLNHLVLSGSPYERGLRAGEAERELLRRQETGLISQLRAIMPGELALRAFLLSATRWFWGIESYFEPWMIEEMYGVSLSAPAEFDTFADALTRQVAYHGLHEVGQLMVDSGQGGSADLAMG